MVIVSSRPLTEVMGPRTQMAEIYGANKWGVILTTY